MVKEGAWLKYESGPFDLRFFLVLSESEECFDLVLVNVGTDDAKLTCNI